jgi:transposase
MSEALVYAAGANRERAERIARLEAETARLSAEVARLTEIIDGRQSETAFLRTRVFGSTSEQLSHLGETAKAAAQAATPLDDDAPEESTTSATTAADADKRKRSRRRARQLEGKRAAARGSKRTAFGPDVAQEIVRQSLPADLTLACPLCGDGVADRGIHSQAEEVDIVPSRVVRRIHLLHRGSCGCGALCFVMPGPDRGLPNTLFSPRFVAQVIVDKFRWHLPLSRQAAQYADQGLLIHRDRLINLVLLAWLALEPLVRKVREANQEQSYQSCDESPVRLVVAGEVERRYLWVLVTKLAVSYLITPLRNKATAREVVGSTPGTLTTDRLAIYRKLFEGKADSGCLAHMRRYFWYALDAFPDEGLAALELVGELYDVEDEAKTLGTDAAARLALRSAKSAPLMAKIHALVSGMDPPPRSALGKAKSYTLDHWAALSHFLGDGEVEIDNNVCERKLRVPKLGWKNWLQPQSEVGADAVAGFYTLIATCELHGRHPPRYLADVLSKVARGWPASRLGELLPWNWQDPANVYGPHPARRLDGQRTAAEVIELAKLHRRSAKIAALR